MCHSSAVIRIALGFALDTGSMDQSSVLSLPGECPYHGAAETILHFFSKRLANLASSFTIRRLPWERTSKGLPSSGRESIKTSTFKSQYRDMNQVWGTFSALTLPPDTFITRWKLNQAQKNKYLFVKIEILATLLKKNNCSHLGQSIKIVQVCIHSPFNIKTVIFCTALLYCASSYLVQCFTVHVSKYHQSWRSYKPPDNLQHTLWGVKKDSRLFYHKKVKEHLFRMRRKGQGQLPKLSLLYFTLSVLGFQSSLGRVQNHLLDHDVRDL